MSIKVMIVEDESLLRQTLVELLRTKPDMEVVAATGDGRQAIADAGAYRPDVILMDINLIGLDGVEATRQIRAALPDTQVVMLTHLSDDEHLFAALKAGAIGYLLKDAGLDQITAGLHTAHAGEGVIYPPLVPRVLAEFQRLSARADRRHELFQTLTRREVEVLELLGCGKRNKEIAAALFIAERTVKNHVSAILAKLHVNDRTEAAIIAAGSGLGTEQNGS